MAKGKTPKKSCITYKQEGRREKNKKRKIAKQLRFQAKKADKAERRASAVIDRGEAASFVTEECVCVD